MRKFYLPRSHGRRKKRFVALLIIVMLIVLTLTATVKLRPLLSNLAATRIANSVNRIVTEAVNETVYGGGVDYDSLISLEKDNNGRITALKSNMAEFNRLQAAVLNDILGKLSEISTRELAIPIGTLTGSPLLAGRGPMIYVRAQSIGSATARFENQFAAAGINQTKHQISLVVDVSMSILLPGISTSAKVSNTFSVAETVIVGLVPESYTSFETDNLREAAEEYIMNIG